MSATNRGTERSPADYYPTPAWCVRRLLEAVPLPGGRWLEPSAGDGAIIRAVNRPDVEWSAVEVRDECRDSLKVAGAHYVEIGDFLSLSSPPDCFDRFAVAILNPPFTHALAFVRASMAMAHTVCVIERLNWLEGEERAGWLRDHAPDVYVLPNRPSFTGEGTDATGYAWLVWPEGGHNRKAGTLTILPSTSPEERRADPRQVALFSEAQPAAKVQPSLFGP